MDLDQAIEIELGRFELEIAQAIVFEHGKRDQQDRVGISPAAAS